MKDTNMVNMYLFFMVLEYFNQKVSLEVQENKKIEAVELKKQQILIAWSQLYGHNVHHLWILSSGNAIYGLSKE